MPNDILNIFLRQTSRIKTNEAISTMPLEAYFTILAVKEATGSFISDVM
jgi:hypothetical protein